MDHTAALQPVPPVGNGRVEATQPMIFSADETTDIGHETGTTPHTRLHHPRQPIHRQDQLGTNRRRQRRPRPYIDPEERLRIAMG
jgi:hypothetical protein